MALADWTNPLVDIANTIINGINAAQSAEADDEAQALAELEFQEQQAQNAQNQANWETQFNYQKGLQDKIFEREDTANQRAVKDMRAAGLSPLANYSSSSAGSVVNTSPYAQDAPSRSSMISAKMAESVNKLTRSAQMQQALNGFKETSLQNAEIQKVKAETDNINASTEATRASTGANLDYTIAQTELLKTQNNQAKLNYTNSQKQFDQTYSKTQTEIALLEEQLKGQKTSNNHADRLASLEEDKLVSDIGMQAQNMTRSLVDMAIAQHQLDYFDVNGYRPKISELEATLTFIKDADPKVLDTTISNIADILYSTYEGIKSRYSSASDLGDDLKDGLDEKTTADKLNEGASAWNTVFGAIIDSILMRNKYNSDSESSTSTTKVKQRFTGHQR